MIKLKVTCFTPKGKAADCIKGWALQKVMSFKAPIEAKIVNDSEFYYIYQYENQKQVNNAMFKKIPATEALIRHTYGQLINKFRGDTAFPDTFEKFFKSFQQVHFLIPQKSYYPAGGVSL